MGNIVVKGNISKTGNKMDGKTEKIHDQTVVVENEETLVVAEPQINENTEDVKEIVEEAKENLENKTSKSAETNDIKKKGIVQWFKKLSFRGDRQNINAGETKETKNAEISDVAKNAEDKLEVNEEKIEELKIVECCAEPKEEGEKLEVEEIVIENNENVIEITNDQTCVEDKEQNDELSPEEKVDEN